MFSPEHLHNFFHFLQASTHLTEIPSLATLFKLAVPPHPSHLFLSAYPTLFYSPKYVILQHIYLFITSSPTTLEAQWISGNVFSSLLHPHHLEQYLAHSWSQEYLAMNE